MPKVIRIPHIGGIGVPSRPNSAAVRLPRVDSVHGQHCTCHRCQPRKLAR